MPIIIRCSSCGYTLYRGKELRTIDDIAKIYNYRCPCCLSNLKARIDEIKFEVKSRNNDRDR